MNRVRRQGFSLIELLVVIAIIAILAGLTFTVLPRVLEKSKITKARSTMSQLNTALTRHFANTNSFPPAYGYIRKDVDINNPALTDAEKFHLEPYTVPLNLQGVEEMYDNFSLGYDTDKDGILSFLEFLPIGTTLADGTFSLPTELYTGSNLAGEVTTQIQTIPSPILYIPVNARQAQLAARYWIKRGIATGNFNATEWDPNDDILRNITFPAPSYDAFALISQGPAGNTNGIVAPVNNPAFTTGPNAYHISALRAYYLASRDLNGNKVLDFDYEARTQQQEHEEVFTVANREGETRNDVSNGTLPDGTGALGPLIYVSQ